jgi:NhaP-type Na+/H+ or K+/H+ antiporter
MEVIHDFKSRTTELINRGYSVKTEAYIRRGWELIRMRIEYFILFALIFFIAASVPAIGFIFVQPLAAGFLIAAFYLSSGKQIIFEDFFDGFKHFAGLFLFTLISTLILFVAFLALFIPGIYLVVGYIFTPFYIVFARMDFWEAMESSRKLVHREWFSIFGFLIVLVFINLLGLLALGVGLLITVPLSYCALYAAFDDIIGVSN